VPFCVLAVSVAVVVLTRRSGRLEMADTAHRVLRSNGVAQVDKEPSEVSTWTFPCLSRVRWRTFTPIMRANASVPATERLTTD